MKTLKKNSLFFALLLFLNGIGSFKTIAQNGTANQPNYLLREYMKVVPGKENEYLKVEKVWKKIHERRIKEGRILAWTLSRRVYYGTNAPYDYVTTTVFKSGKEIDEAASLNWDYIIAGLSPEDLAIVNTTGDTRKMVSSQLLYQTQRVQAEGSIFKYWQITQVKAKQGFGADLEKYEAMMKPVFEEAAKSGQISGWRFGENLFPRRANDGNYYRVIITKNMEDMLNSEKNPYLLAAFKKVYPTKDWKVFSKAMNDIITILDVDLWERIDSAAN